MRARMRAPFRNGTAVLFSSCSKGRRTCSGLPLDIPTCVSGLKLRCISPLGDSPCGAGFGVCCRAVPVCFCGFVRCRKPFWFWFLLSRRKCRWLVCLSFRWHPRYDFPFLVLPLCGAAPTFLCRRKE